MPISWARRLAILVQSATDRFASEYQRRRFQRFRIKTLVEAEFWIADCCIKLNVESSNVSSGGIQLESTVAVPLHAEVNLVMSLRPTPRAIHLLATGDVVRVEQWGDTFTIAVQFMQPVTEVDTVMGSVVLKPATDS